MRITFSVFALYVSNAALLSGVDFSSPKLSICPVNIFKAAISIVNNYFTNITFKMSACTRCVFSHVLLHFKLNRHVLTSYPVLNKNFPDNLTKHTSVQRPLGLYILFWFACGYSWWASISYIEYAWLRLGIVSCIITQ